MVRVWAGTSLLLWLALGSTTSAAEADLVIRNATLFSAVDGEFIEGATLVVAGNRIQSVSVDPARVEAAIQIDAGGSTVMPGLIDTHVHLFFDLHDVAYFPTNDTEASEYMERQLPEKLKAHLEQGFTSVFSSIDFWPQIVDVRERMASQEIAAPRLFVAGGVFVAPGDHYICSRLEGERKSWCNEHLTAQISNPEEAREAVARYAASGVDAIVYDSLTNASAVDVAFVRSLAEAAHESGLPLLVHTADAKGFGSLVEAGVDGFIHPPSGDSPEAQTGWAMAGQRHMPLGITIGETEQAIRDGKRTEEEIAAYKLVRKNTQALLAQGALPVFASDLPGAPPAYAAPIVFRSLQDLGLSVQQILLASTRDAARALGKEDELGTLEKGKRADILMIRGDPRSDFGSLTNVELVIKDGRIVVDKRQSHTQDQ